MLSQRIAQAQAHVQDDGQARTEWVNLSIHRLQWNPEGLARARELVRQRQAALAAEGWLCLNSADDHDVLHRGRGLNGPVVIGASLRLRRAR
jgi:hypothetical protein